MKVTLLVYLSVLIILNLSAQSDSIKDNNKFEYHFIDDRVPEYPGGDNALIEFLRKNLKYPQMEYDNKIEGRVVVTFVVNEDGSVGDVIVLKGVSIGFDNEAIRVIKKLPKFKPVTANGKPEKSKLTLPIWFKLNEDEPIITKINSKSNLKHIQSNLFIKKWETEFCNCFKTNFLKHDKKSTSIIVDFSLTKKRGIADFVIRSGNSNYDGKNITKCLGESVGKQNSDIPRELLHSKYWMTITIQ